MDAGFARSIDIKQRSVDRPPSQKAFGQLKPVLTIYNLLNVLLSSYISYAIVAYKFTQNVRTHARTHAFAFAFACYAISPSFPAIRPSIRVHTQPAFICNTLPPGDHGLAPVLCLFYLQKFFEFFDTYFFILRKSFRQVRMPLPSALTVPSHRIGPSADTAVDRVVITRVHAGVLPPPLPPCQPDGRRRLPPAPRLWGGYVPSRFS